MKNLIKKYEEIIRYLIIGFLSTCVSLAIYYFLTFTILDPNNPIKLQLANIISWIITIIFAYFTNRKYVFFKKEKPNFKEFFQFGLSRVLTLIIDMILMYILVSKLKFNDKIIKLIVQVIVIILNYIFSKFLVFKRNKYEQR